MQCALCGWDLTNFSESFRTQHKRIPHIFGCNQCNFCLTSKHSLQKHKSKQHANPLYCKLCHFEIPNHHRKILHEKLTHNFICSCKMRFRRLRDLLKHQSQVCYSISAKLIKILS